LDEQRAQPDCPGNPVPHAPLGNVAGAAPSLRAAMRRARIEEAERAEVVAELRGAELARLDMLNEELAPVFAQVPAHVDLFDTGLVPGDHPRLFIDMIAFVEMGRDRRQYRLLQDTRYGRVVLAETERLETMVEAVANYIARRLVEREQALAGDRTLDDAARDLADRRTAPAVPVAAPPAAEAPRRRPRLVARLLLFVIDFVGAVVLALGLAFLCLWSWKVGWAWWLANHGAG
jgi:hypothetical protein